MNWTRFRQHQGNKGVDGRYTIHKDSLVIVVYGSNSKHDWIGDTKIFPRKTLVDGVKLHRFFYDSASFLLQFMAGLVHQHQPKTIKLYGHSYGGAVCEIAAAVYGWNKPISVTTYGSPKAGNKRFYDYLYARAKVRHLRNKGDIVPFLPPWPWYRGREEAFLLGRWRPVWAAHDPRNYPIP